MTRTCTRQIIPHSLGFFAALLLLLALASLSPAQAYHFPWDQAHDYTDWDDPNDDNGPCEGGDCETDPEDECSKQGSPVYVATGHFTWRETDVVLPGRPMIQLTRTYQSHDPRNGLFGNGWSFTCDRALYVVRDTLEGGGVELAYILRGANGERRRFPIGPELVEHSFQSRGQTLTIVPQTDGSIHVVQPTGAYESYASGRLIAEVDAHGNRISYQYEGDQLVRIEDGNGRWLDFTYTSRGHVGTVTDQAGRTWRYDYDAAGSLVAVTNPAGDTRRYGYRGYRPQYDAQVYYQLTQVEDEAGIVLTTVTYNGNRVASYTEGANRWTYTYDPANRITRKIDSLGARIQYRYDANGDVVESTDPLGNIERTPRDGNGAIASITDAAGATWRFMRDALGRVTQATDPLGAVTTYAYTGELSSPSLVTSPTGRRTAFQYDAAGLSLSVEDSRGAVTRFEWDERGNPVAVISAEGDRTEFAYNAIGLPVTIVDPLGRTTEVSYDPAGNRVMVRNAAGELTRFEYDPLGRVTRVLDPLGHTTSFTYDAAGRPIAVVNAKGNATQLEYDEHGRVSARVWPSGARETYRYRTDNLLDQVTRRDGTAVTYHYDLAGRLVREDAGSDWVTYVYDERGELIRAENEVGVVTRRYDLAGRLIEEVVNGETAAFDHNAEGERTRLTLLGQTIEYERDALGLITRIQDSNGAFDFSYDLVGRRVSMTRPDGSSTNYDYDAAGQLTRLTHSGAFSADYHYSYDALGRITQWLGGDSGWSYQYDGAGRLLQAAVGADLYTYAYDEVGNRTERNGQYDADNRLVEDADYVYTYDGNGNLIEQRAKASNERVVFSWNARGQLITLERYHGAEAVEAISYSYGPLNRRWGRSGGAEAERYAYNGLDRAATLDTSGGVLSRSTFGPFIDEPLATNDSMQTASYYFANHQLSVMAVNGPHGLERYAYGPYGEGRGGSRRRQPLVIPRGRWSLQASTTTARGTMMRNGAALSRKTPWALVGAT